jgi:hypothetical protein
LLVFIASFGVERWAAVFACRRQGKLAEDEFCDDDAVADIELGQGQQ